MKVILALCAIWLHCNSSIDALRCDFADPDGLLKSNALARCHVNIEEFDSATVICPRTVAGTDYVLHPQPNSYENSHINTYVSYDGTFRSVALSDVIATDAPAAFASVELDQLQTTLNIDLSAVGLFSIIERRLMFICGPRDLDLSGALQRHLNRLNGIIQMEEIPWNPATPLTEEIRKIRSGLGVFFLYRGNVHLPLQGCGSRPSPLFAPGNDVTVDPITGVRSCVADPMSQSRIGFVCEGRLEPEDCMRSLTGQYGEDVVIPTPHSYMKFDYHKPWVVAKYFNGLELPRFHGECRCIDSDNGQVKARIEIRTKTDYVCDITNMIFRNDFRPIRGPWCSFVLHPGSTLTIRFPPEDVDEEPSEKDSTSGPPSQKPPKYLFTTRFMPTDLVTLRQLKSIYEIDVYDEVLYKKAIAGDALELDVSQISKGEVKLKYHDNKPLSLRLGPNSFYFHWTLRAINKYTFKSITAPVDISFAFTHNYKMVGCDSGAESLFDTDMSRAYCSTKSMGNGIGDIYECSYPIKWERLQTGIHCGPDGELVPDNCESTGYDLYSNRIIPSPGSVRNATPYPIRGFQIFDIELNYNIPVSYACYCVDKFGYATSRLVLTHNSQYDQTYLVRRKADNRMLPPYVLLPWGDAGLSNEASTAPNSLMLENISQESVILHVGTSVFMSCEPELQNDANNGLIKTTWLPKQHHLFYYTVNETPHGFKLIRKGYEESISATPGALEFTYLNIDGTTVYQTMVLKSHRGAILISKHSFHKKHVPITFVCGKTPEPSDLSVSGDTYASPHPSIALSSAPYTWNVVQVAVETTDPYMQGCGVTYASDELFKPETPQLYDADGKSHFGCKIDIQAAKEAAFYCPAPYVLDPLNCFSQVYVDGEVRKTRDISESLVALRSNHFVILSLDSSLVGPGETLHQTPPFQCRCVTVKGAVLLTIQIGNYYST
ncbi:hypothetical protein, conserved [Babesia ovata]|uniref:6-Cys domain-containing protein n=1 Tax=Babesia ovata TaxID=189622 RepID=A0A2H6K6D4_9APIC|nr:uncharacterized protein BOVATA_000470 [Babesia ovata]GBE58554.1 hypothetical protein, conserved [Babesia ovata]